MPIRVLIVDDSRTACAALRAAFAADPSFEVIAEAATGREAVAKAEASRPDLVTMDVFLPGSNGIEATAAIMASAPTRVVIVTSAGSEDPDLIYRAMQAGALEVWPKPPSLSHPAYAAEIGRFLKALKALARVPVVRRSVLSGRREPGPIPAARDEPRPPLSSSLPPPGPCDALLIGASTGGPPTIEEILRGLPRDFPAPIVVVQHITPGFIQGLANWLVECTNHPVEIITNTRTLKSGRVYLAGDGSHTVFVSRHTVGISPEKPGDLLCPSVDRLFESAADHLGAGCIAVLLTGMGSDGARGLLKLKTAGAFTIVQAPETCVVEGMPSAALRLDAAISALAPRDIPREVRKRLAASAPQGPGAPSNKEEGTTAADGFLSTYKVNRKRFGGRPSDAAAENGSEDDDNLTTYYEAVKRKGGS